MTFGRLDLRPRPDALDTIQIGLRLSDDQLLIAHIPQDELNGATVGDVVTVDLRNPKAFHREEAEAAVPSG